MQADIVISSDDEIVGVPLHPIQDRWTQRSARYGVLPCVFQTLLLVGCPPIIFNLLWFLNSRPDIFPLERDIQVLEMFSGVGMIHGAADARGWIAARYDVDHDAVQMDFMQCAGFLMALGLVRRMARGSLCTWATKCSSWIWLVRAVTMRSSAQPEGPTVNPHPTRARSLDSNLRSLLHKYPIHCLHFPHRSPRSCSKIPGSLLRVSGGLMGGPKGIMEVLGLELGEWMPLCRHRGELHGESSNDSAASHSCQG